MYYDCIHLQLYVNHLAKMKATAHLPDIVTAKKNGQEFVVDNVMNCHFNCYIMCRIM